MINFLYFPQGWYCKEKLDACHSLGSFFERKKNRIINESLLLSQNLADSLHLGFHTFVLFIVVGFSVELVKTFPPEPQLMLV